MEPGRCRHGGGLPPGPVHASPRGGRAMSPAVGKTPHSFYENTAADVPSPGSCTHLTGADHLASLSAALRSLDGQLDVLDRWGGLLADVLCGGSRGRLLAAGNGGSAAQAQHLTAEL